MKNIRFILLVEDLDSLYDFQQRAGRAGRDNNQAEVVAFVSNHSSIVNDFLKDESSCFRSRLQFYFDGDHDEYCFSDPRNERCHICLKPSTDLIPTGKN